MKILKSYAKINIFLEILNKDISNGYHFLSTMICSLENYYDILSIEKDKSFSVSLSGKYIFEDANILEKTVQVFRENFEGDTNFKVNIEKNIKIGAGLGGGSSNAGVFLHFLMETNKINVSEEEFAKAAIQIGTDVPYFYNNKPKICQGYGEKLENLPFLLPPEIYALIILPNSFISTPAIFKKILPQTYKINPSLPKTFEKALIIENDLEKYAAEFAEEINDIITFLKKLPHTLKVSLSGSGSACFALFENYEAAKNAQSLCNLSYKTLISKIFT